MKCHQGWKAIHFNTYVKKLLLIKLWRNEEDFEIFPHNFERTCCVGLQIKIHVLDFNALFDVHVIEYLDNSIFY
jgi:hypothetical protein